MMRDSGYSHVTPEDFLEHEGVDYRATSGSRGPQFNIKTCPVCGGSKWKVYLSQDTGFGNCFHGSCEESFNLWTFAKAHLGTTDNVAVGRLFDEIAKGVGWKPKKFIKKTYAPVLDGDLKLPNSIPVPDGNLPYLENRGVDVATAREFGLRMCINGAHKYKDESGNDRMMPFTGRLIIPIYDIDGKLVTFQGRDISGSMEQKYLFPPRLPSTGRFIYNGHRAKSEGWSHVVMNEGAFDVISTQMAIDQDRSLVGLGAVGSFGKKLTLDVSPGTQSQLQALLELKKAGLKTITIMWDGEASALMSACKAADKLVGFGFAVRIAFLPPNKDPNEISSSAVRLAIRTARPYTKSLYVRLMAKNPYKASLVTRMFQNGTGQ